MKKVKNNRTFPISCKSEGYVLIKKRPMSKSRIHSASCYLLHHMFHDSNLSKHEFGNTKDKKRYYFASSIDILKKIMKSHANRDIQNIMHKCSQCRNKADETGSNIPLHTHSLKIQTKLPYNNIFRVVHFMYHKTGDCDFRLYRHKLSGKYFVWAAPTNRIITDPDIEHIKHVGGFEFGDDEYDAGIIFMNIAKNVQKYFTKANRDNEPAWYDDNDISTMEVHDVVSEINSPDR